MIEAIEIPIISGAAALAGSLIGTAGGVFTAYTNGRNSLRLQSDKLEHDAQSARQERIRVGLAHAYDVLSGVKDTAEINLKTAKPSVTNPQAGDLESPFFDGDLDKLSDIYISQREKMRDILLAVRAYCVEARSEVEKIYHLLECQHSLYRNMIQERRTDSPSFDEYSRDLSGVQNEIRQLADTAQGKIVLRFDPRERLLVSSDRRYYWPG